MHKTLCDGDTVPVSSNISKEFSDDVLSKEDYQYGSLLLLDSIEPTDKVDEDSSITSFENEKPDNFSPVLTLTKQSNRLSRDHNVFGNCPWNLNSSILMNSAAERQAQKRKIRNGQLPIPKLLNSLKMYDAKKPCATTRGTRAFSPESKLPDTIEISLNFTKEEYSNDVPIGCEKISLTRICDESVIPSITEKSSHVKIPSSLFFTLPDTLDVKQLHCNRNTTTDVKGQWNENGKCYEEALSTKTNISLSEENYKSLPNSAFLQKASLEKDDGLVLKLNCSDSQPKVLTVIQEKRVTYWESHSHYHHGSKVSKWLKLASLPVFIGVSRDKVSFIEWALGLRPDGWKSVVLQIDFNESRGLLYAYDSPDITKSNAFIMCHEHYRNIEKLKICLVDLTTVVTWCTLKEKRGTMLSKYLLKDDLTGLLKVNELVGVISVIKSLYQVNACKPLIAGIDEDNNIFIWDHITGSLLKTVELVKSQINSSIGIVEDMGFLFLLINDKPGFINLLALNINSEKWMIVRNYSSDFEECFTGYVIVNGQLFASYQQGLIVWDVKSGVELASVLTQGAIQTYVFSSETIVITADHEIFTTDNSQILNMKKCLDKTYKKV